ncbi:MAG: glycosyltransferase family 2 protein [Leptolyngbyaceae cyanobacterium bins.349]|nr:glycosyltransferase family 2 protein [Leptolyngbyaceae cyanobacterium bins.349]
MINGSKSPLVSVIIPTYNRSEYLQEAIASVLDQTFQDFEVIVSDDCSLDNSRALVDSFRDARIRFRRNSTNLGVADNVTQAIKLATGKYIASLNDDDQWTETFLEKLVTPLEANPELVLSFCDYFVMDDQGVIHDQWTTQQSHQEKRDRLGAGIYQPFWDVGLIDQAVFMSCAAVLRRDAIALAELPNAGVFWDYYLAYLACRTGQGAYYCNERLALYRRHRQSENMLSGSRNVQAKIRKGKAGVFCYAQFAKDAPASWMKRYFWQEWAHANTTLGIGLMRDRQFVNARTYLQRSLQQHPFNLRTLVAFLLSYSPESLASPISQLRNLGILSKAR